MAHKESMHKVDNRPRELTQIEYAKEFGIDFGTIYSIKNASPKERSMMRKSRMSDPVQAKFVLPGSGKYIPYAGQIKDKSGLTAEGALTMGFIRVMDVESGLIAGTMGVSWFQKHAIAIKPLELEAPDFGGPA